VRLEVEDLAFGYRGRPVGRGVSFAVEPGRVLVLLGPNGSGKTTLFKTVLGLLPRLGGSIRLDGTAMESLSRAEVARRIGYVPQAHAAYFPFTVEDVVLMGRVAHLGPFSAPGRADRAAAHAALERLGVAALAGQTYTRISGGERQLVLVARALAQAPRLLVMDEPTANLDFGNQVQVLRQIAALSRDGISVILSTHDPDHAFLCADTALLLHRGTLAAVGPPAATVTTESLRLLYGVDIRVVEAPLPEGGTRRVCVPAVATLPNRTAAPLYS